MWRVPVGALAEDEAPPGEELEDVMPRLQDLALERLSAPDDIPHALLGLARDPHHGELSGAKEAGEVGRVALVMLALHPGSLRDEGGGDDLARIPPLLERAVQHVARPACLVARAEVSVCLLYTSPSPRDS